MQSSCPQGLMVNLFHWIAGSPCYTKAAHLISVRATYCVVAPVQVSHKRLVLEITFGSNDACVPANTIHFNPSSVEEVQINPPLAECVFPQCQDLPCTSNEVGQKVRGV